LGGAHAGSRRFDERVRARRRLEKLREPQWPIDGRVAGLLCMERRGNEQETDQQVRSQALRVHRAARASLLKQGEAGCRSVAA
jgi:hypothetical protein